MFPPIFDIDSFDKSNNRIHNLSLDTQDIIVP